MICPKLTPWRSAVLWREILSLRGGGPAWRQLLLFNHWKPSWGDRKRCWIWQIDRWRVTSHTRVSNSPIFLWSIQERARDPGAGIFPWSEPWDGLCNCTGVPCNTKHVHQCNYACSHLYGIKTLVCIIHNSVDQSRLYNFQRTLVPWEIMCCSYLRDGTTRFGRGDERRGFWDMERPHCSHSFLWL